MQCCCVNASLFLLVLNLKLLANWLKNYNKVIQCVVCTRDILCFMSAFVMLAVYSL